MLGYILKMISIGLHEHNNQHTRDLQEQMDYFKEIW